MPPCQKYQKTMKNCCSSEEKTLSFQHTRQFWRFIILLLSLIFYTCVCAAVFSSLEKDNDREHYDRSQGLKKSYKLKYNMSEEEFIEFVSDVSIWFKRGYIHGHNNYWNFYHSFWFTTTVVTTMGFGQVTPLTFGGRLFCIFCALLGIPLNLVVLKTVGERITRYIHSIIIRIERKYRGSRRISHVGIKATMVSFLMMVMVLSVSGAADMIFDGWTFFDGVYFNFIAYSTIGFGDLFPRVENASKLDKLGLGENGKRLFATFVMLSFMIIGLSVTSTVICSILQAIEEMSLVPATLRSSRATVCSQEDSVKLKSVEKKANEAERLEMNSNNSKLTRQK